MRRTTLASVLLALLAAPLGGCGDERMERGLAAPDEQAVPESPAELGESAAERQRQEDAEDDAASRRDFDAVQDEAAKALDEQP